MYLTSRRLFEGVTVAVIAIFESAVLIGISARVHFVELTAGPDDNLATPGHVMFQFFVALLKLVVCAVDTDSSGACCALAQRKSQLQTCLMG